MNDRKRDPLPEQRGLIFKSNDAVLQARAREIEMIPHHNARVCRSRTGIDGCHAVTVGINQAVTEGAGRRKEFDRGRDVERNCHGDGDQRGKALPRFHDWRFFAPMGVQPARDLTGSRLYQAEDKEQR